MKYINITGALTAIICFSFLTGCSENSYNYDTESDTSYGSYGHYNMSDEYEHLDSNVLYEFLSIEGSKHPEYWSNDCVWVSSNSDEYHSYWDNYNMVGISNEPDSYGDDVVRAVISRVTVYTNDEVSSTVSENVWMISKVNSYDEKVYTEVITTEDRKNWKVISEIENVDYYDAYEHGIEIPFSTYLSVVGLDINNIAKYNIAADFLYTDASYGFGNVNVDTTNDSYTLHSCKSYDNFKDIEGNFIYRDYHTDKWSFDLNLLVNYEQLTYDCIGYIANDNTNTISVVSYDTLPMHLDKINTNTNVTDVPVYKIETFKYDSSDRGYVRTNDVRFYINDEDHLTIGEYINVTYNDITSINDEITTTENIDEITEEVIEETTETTNIIDSHEYCISKEEGIRLGLIEIEQASSYAISFN